MGKGEVAIIGTGLMGRGIAHSFANNGYRVSMFGYSQGYKSRVIDYFKHEVIKKRITEYEMDQLLSRIRFLNMNGDLDKLYTADIVIEAVKEEKQLKKDIFKQIDKYAAKDCIIATNTSTYSITEIGAILKRPERFLGMHFISPVQIMDVVELVKGYRTSQDTIDVARQIVISINKVSYVVKDNPGFVINRLLVPMFNEASMIISEGLVDSPEMLDELMKEAMNLKIGPLMLADLVGLDSIYYSIKSLYDNFHDSKYRPCLHLKKMVEAGYLGKKSGKGFYEYEDRED
ncbi:3-hydroxyacyl-CoA dehydrogenase family protein [Lutispora sp.]|uniref:3-hydroxyacyl-CoA dehydrogenase family protein n=1 Tax=Lutispora sp. TaxID=2828727 RepID=UPI002B20ADF7|nr:3-hydroxyacyl-CoA dehydrogenase NAD-binding domain-containing protein [Lutispora sp.]MEA4962228.1 3-hydroxyacyl-CoA dehydrogenase NAD-binding domain-containing protein [Lutispora sp.]